MKITFNINFHTVWGQRLYVVGSIPELGLWNPALAAEMSYKGDGNWQLEIEPALPVETLEYRYFLSVGDKHIFEEWEKNHCVTFEGHSNRYILYDYWQIRPANKAFYSSAFTKSWFAHPRDTHERTVRSGKRLTIKISAPRVEKSQSVIITGNQECLGNWQPDKALRLSCDTFPDWYIDLDAEDITYPLEYKFLVFDNERQIPLFWEENENRRIDLPQQECGETVVVSGLYFRDNLPSWRCAGTVVPVFSLRSEQGFGVGDLGDLQMLVDWAKMTRQRIIQVLPMNDTTTTHTWRDSYPYSAISVYALHPMYISLRQMGELKDADRMAFYKAKQEELNAKDTVDYEAAVRYKTAYCREFFGEEGQTVLSTSEYREFFGRNRSWLVPYAAYCYLRDRYGTTDFSRWGKYATYNSSLIRELCSEEGDAYPEISFYYFLQYILHGQFKSVSDYARESGVVLKGDLPIGVSRTSVEVWTEPQYFNMSGQAGAPPDDFSVNGQNWGFPTYDWSVMEKDGFSWWKRRFCKLGDYFDCFRIDHILGFFRIWEVPFEYIQGLCGHFNPALPLAKGEIERYGMAFNEARFTTPHINRRFLPELFGDVAKEVEGTYLAQSSSNHFVLKPFCDTQRKIDALFEGKTDETALRIRNGLFTIANEVLFLRDRKEKEKFHPRISASRSYMYTELSASDKYAFDQLYWDFFYHRHNDFWKDCALSRLTPLVGSTDMLICGEDLGMIPGSVPEVMNKLRILSLEIERMPKSPRSEFTDMQNLPYNSVCTTSTHDMSPLRSWWKEDREKTQRYYNSVLHMEGQAPEECSSEIATRIVSRHLAANAMLAIIPLQDWFATCDEVRRKDYEAERINVPAESNHYWRYRMHITLERLLSEDRLNTKISDLIAASGR